MYALAQSFGFALRQLRKTPGFALTVVLTLALGIGATTAIFSLVEGILLRPLPFRNPDRLVLVGDHIGGGPNTPVTAREIGTYSTATNAFSSLGGFATTDYELSDGVATPQEVHAGRLAATVFPTLAFDPSSAASSPRRKKTPTSRSPSSATPSGRATTTAIPTSSAAPSFSTAGPTPSSASCPAASSFLCNPGISTRPNSGSR
jgi:hypothetical protein